LYLNIPEKGKCFQCRNWKYCNPVLPKQEKLMADYSGVMVYCTLEHNDISVVSRELLGEGARLAAVLGEELYAAIITPELGENVAVEAGFLGARRLYCIEDPVFTHFLAQEYARSMEYVVRQVRPAILLIGATVEGRDLAARLAVRLETGLTADCTHLAIASDGLLLQTRPAYGGNVTATIVCTKSRPQMATVRPGIFPVPAPNRSLPKAELVHFSVPSGSPATVQVLATELISSKDDILGTAHCIVACGRGIRNKTGLHLAECLAQALGGELGASRGAVEAGFLPRNRQIGQTGKIVRPVLYIACGISGAIQHLVGMKQAQYVIAINNDPEAPIFKEADYGICGDLFVVLPELIKISRK
jgi:electron transfer flavoprotein alpha subunit